MVQGQINTCLPMIPKQEKQMSHTVRFIKGVFTTIPLNMFAVCLLSLSINEYYWITYALMSIFYIGSSIFFWAVPPAPIQLPQIK
jgi:hypothetical protein